MRGVASMVFTFVVAGLGCASLPPCPHRGGPAWREYATAHFDVRTDLGPRDAEQVVRDLEETRALILMVARGGQDQSQDRTRVIVFASDLARQALVGGLDGMFIRSLPFPATVLFAGARFSNLPTLRHELTHDISASLLPVQPEWLSEGLAAYMETARYDREQRRGYVGDMPLPRILIIGQEGLFDTARLLQGAHEDTPFELARFENTSWLLVHYLMNKRGEAFRRYQRRLRALEPSPQAWKEEFPDLDPATLSTSLAEYSRAGRFSVGSRTIAPWEGTVHTRVLSDAEVHAMRAYLYARFHAPGAKPDSHASAAELEEAFRQEHPPIEAMALAFYDLGGWHGGTRAALAREAVATHPESPLAWLMLADSKDVADPEYRKALVRALARGPDNLSVLGRLALVATSQQRWDEALAFSTEALIHGSVSDEVRLLHGLALAQNGKCVEAVRWAIVLGSLGSKRPKQLPQLLGHLKQSCASDQPQQRAAPRGGR